MSMNDAQDDEFLFLLVAEVQKARAKFPQPEYTMTALTEEVGELARACLHQVQASEPTPYARDNILKEAVQVAAVAMRLATEGDQSLSLDPPMKALGE